MGPEEATKRRRHEGTKRRRARGMGVLVGGGHSVAKERGSGVKQILVNLLTNAVKFTKTGGRVTLKTWCHADSGYVFQVMDTGIGIAREDIPRALSQFGQIDSAVSRKHVGTGLGLPLTKSMVELHGGSFDLQSEIGVGTTVTVCFPADRIVDLPAEKTPYSAA